MDNLRTPDDTQWAGTSRTAPIRLTFAFPTPEHVTVLVDGHASFVVISNASKNMTKPVFMF